MISCVIRRTEHHEALFKVLSPELQVSTKKGGYSITKDENEVKFTIVAKNIPGLKAFAFSLIRVMESFDKIYTLKWK